MQNKTFNFYCDESTHLENDGFPYMIIAYVSSAWNQVKLHSDNLRRLKEEHRFKGEIKWSKLSESNYAFYAEIIDYFFATDLNFRAVARIRSSSRTYENKVVKRSFRKRY